MGLPTRLLTRLCLVTLSLAVPSGAAFAFAITDAQLTVSNLTMTPDSGTLSILDLQGNPVGALGSSGAASALGSFAGTNAFNSFGESDAHSTCNTIFAATVGSCDSVVAGTDVGASAAVTFASGTAQALGSSLVLKVSSLVDIPDNVTVLAGVNSPGSNAALTGAFEIDNATASSVNITVSMLLSGKLHGVSNPQGFLQIDDVTAVLSIDGSPVLFDFETLPGLPDLAGIPDYPETTIPISLLLTGTIAVDPTLTHSFGEFANAESQAFNIPEPGSAALLLAGLGALAWRRREPARQRAERREVRRRR